MVRDDEAVGRKEREQVEGAPGALTFCERGGRVLALIPRWNLFNICLANGLMILSFLTAGRTHAPKNG
jgi:hypothetical protein